MKIHNCNYNHVGKKSLAYFVLPEEMRCAAAVCDWETLTAAAPAAYTLWSLIMVPRYDGAGFPTRTFSQEPG